MSVINTDKTTTTTPFGQWLSRQRKARDLTQEELADRLGCSVWSIQKIEVGNRRPSKQLAEILAGYFAIPDVERAAFMRFARGQTGDWQPSAAGPDAADDGRWTMDDGVLEPASLPTSSIVYRPSSGEGTRLSSYPGNLPVHLTSFVGRKVELPRVRDVMLASAVRLLTLTGPPGTGKTRLALQVAAELRRDFPDGAFLVNLAPISDPGLVAAEIARTLEVRDGRGLSALESVKGYLRDKHLLLVLDNFEQVVEAAPAVAELLMAAPFVKVIATSRVPLHIRGEKEFAVPPLHLADPERLPSLDGLGRYEAVRLFVERAAAVADNFELTVNNAATIARICAQLDGLPLAIELAAARVKVLSPQAILAELVRARHASPLLDLLAGGPRDLPLRQRTLRDAIEWSYNLLDEEEKKLFKRLAVFVGGFALGAVEEVCWGTDDGRWTMDDGGKDGGSLISSSMVHRPSSAAGILDGVHSLIDNSLLRAELTHSRGPEDAGVEPRWGMLGTIHEYAREKLLESGEADLLRRAHALYFMRLAEETEPHLKGAGQQEWLDRLEAEHDNLRAELQWAVDNDSAGAVEIGLRTAGAVWQFWSVHGYLHEGRAHLAKLLERAQANTEEARDLRAYRAKALNGAGVLADLQGDYASAVTLHQESLAIMRELGDKRGIVVSLNNLGAVAQQQGEHDIARKLYEESLALKREFGDKWSVSITLSNLGLVAQQQGDYACARSLFEESLSLARELEDKKGVGIALNNLGLVAQLQGDHEAARSLYEESLALKNELGDKRGVAMSLGNLGLVSLEQGDYTSARSQFLESLTLRRELGDKWGIALSLAGLGGVAVAEAAGSRQSAVGGPQSAEETLPTAEKGARLLSAVEALLESIGGVLSEEDCLPYERAKAAARAYLGDEEFETAWQEGRAMSMEQAINYALSET